MQKSVIYNTNNNGQNWTQQFSTNIQNDFAMIKALNKNNIWCGTYYQDNKIFVSKNGGTTWGFQISPININSGLYFYDTLFGFSWSSTQIARTTNGGGAINQILKIKEQIADEYELNQNYPNPFNNSTIIEYEIPRISVINLKLYDILGKEVLEIIKPTELNNGRYRTVLNLDNKQLSSGVYIYRLTISEKNKSNVITIAKRLIYSK